jgi:ABC-type antimicrobial peptide transport system permease subunit
VVSAFAVFALLLAAVGLYGALGQFVVQRTPEIGVRMAVGARPADVLGLVVRQATIPMMVGVVVGFAGAWVVSRSLASLLYGVGAGDPATLAGAAVGLVMAGLAAAVIPARRAVRVDPTMALRNE